MLAENKCFEKKVFKNCTDIEEVYKKILLIEKSAFDYKINSSFSNEAIDLVISCKDANGIFKSQYFMIYGKITKEDNDFLYRYKTNINSINPMLIFTAVWFTFCASFFWLSGDIDSITIAIFNCCLMLFVIFIICDGRKKTFESIDKFIDENLK